MDDIHARLGALRRHLGLSLRDMSAAILQRARFEVSHDSIRRYEKGGTVPSSYIAALREGFGISGGWLLFGEGDPQASAAPLDETIARAIGALRERATSGRRRDRGQHLREQWARLLEGLPRDHPLHAAILEVRGRPAAWGSDGQQRADGVEDGDWRRRARDNRRLIEVAEPHLAWLRVILGEIRHVAYLVCRDGIVIHVSSPDRGLVERWRLLPEGDGLEGPVPTNGAAGGRDEGAEGSVGGGEPPPPAAYLASPIHGSNGDPLGGLHVAAALGEGGVERLAAVAYTALMIERDLKEKDAA